MSGKNTMNVGCLVAAVAALGAVLAAPPATAQEAERIVAVVNDDAVTMHDLDARVRIAIMSTGVADSMELRSRVAPQVLRKVIDERLELQEAARLKLTVSDSEIEGGIATIEKRNRMSKGQLLGMLRSNGIDPNAMRTQVKAELAWQKSVRRTVVPNVKIGEEEIDARLDALKAAQGKPEFLISEIFIAVDTPDADDDAKRLADRLHEQLQQGVPFPSLARQFSQSASAALGGDLGWVPAGVMDSDLDAALVEVRAGRVTPVVRAMAGYYILGVRDQRVAGANTTDVRLKLAQVYVSAEKGGQPKAAEVSGRVKSCGDMERLSKELQADQSGAMGDVRAGDLPEALRGVVLGLRVGEASRPIAAPGGGFSVMMVCERQDAAASLPKREDIEHKLEDERAELMSKRYLRDLRRSAFIDVRV